VSVILDKNGFDWCTIDSTQHIENSLGSPTPIPEDIRERLSDRGLSSEMKHTEIPNFLKSVTGREYKFYVRNNTYNEENDLDQFFIYTIYVPVGERDPFWCDNCVVFIEMGNPGDPRYVYYSEPEMYLLEDQHLGDSCFFEWILSWIAFPLSGSLQDPILEHLNEKLSSGYSSNPSHELRVMCYHEPIWSEKFQGFVGRPVNYTKPLIFYPCAPSVQ